MSELDVIIAPSEPRYWVALGACVLAGVAMAKWANRENGNQRTTLRLMGSLMLGFQVLDLLLALTNPSMSFSVHRSLPLHFCGLNAILLGCICFKMNKAVFAFAGFMGMIGGFHSVITPQLPSGDALPLFLLFYAKHSALVFVPIVLSRSFDLRFRRWDWARTYVWAVIISTLMMGFNGLLNLTFPHPDGLVANYMYVWEAPMADNPLVLDWGWPWYLLPLHVALLVHLLLINAAFRRWLPSEEGGKRLRWFE